MSTMTFRAGDNATALEMVERRLGGDALILSTVYIDGRVEITATDDALSAPARDPARPHRRIDMTLDEDVALEAPVTHMHADAVTPTQERNDAALPSFLRSTAPRPFAAVLEDVLQDPRPQSCIKPNTPPVASTTVTELRSAMLAASRIALVGPCGAGKTQIALQLALLCRDHRPDIEVSFVFCGTGSRADGAVLAQKSHMLGMNTAFKTPSQLSTPSSDRVEIVLLSGRANIPVLEAHGLLNAPDTRTLLVLPDGLASDRIARVTAQWRGITTSVSFGHVAAADRFETANRLSAEDDLDLLWLSDPDALVDGLWPAEAEAPAVRTAMRAVETKTLPEADPGPSDAVFCNTETTPEAWS